MAVLEIEEIQELIKADQPDFIKEAKKKQKVLNVHINARGLDEYLIQIEGHETKDQFKLRKQVAISNKFLFANLLRPVDKVFNAKGGSKIYNIDGGDSGQKKIREQLSNVRFGKSLRNWIQTVHMNKYYSDPAGIVFFEWQDSETWPTLKSIQSIKNYQTKGRSLDWIVFEGVKRKDDEGKDLDGEFVRVVDDEKDYMFHVNGDQIKLLEDETFDVPEAWGRVPAIVNSDILNDELQYSDSPVDIIVELGDKYLRGNTVKTIFEFLHGYPFFWRYTQKCKSCKGTGERDGEDCSTCKGTGISFKKDVSDGMFLNTPKDKDAPIIAPDVAGYIAPSVETWQEMRDELKFVWVAMQFTLWGTSFEDNDNPTATAKFLDAQPVNERLGGFSDATEDLEQKMTDFIGEFYFPTAYKNSSVNYGRRYMMEPPDVIWKKYLDAKEKGAPQVSLDHLLMQFYQSEFMNDIEMLAVVSKGMKLEPFVHNTVEEVKGTIDDVTLKRKVYFGEWWKTMDEKTILMKNLKQLNKLLDKFVEPLALASDSLDSGDEGSGED
jgi:hypothetical protein